MNNLLSKISFKAVISGALLDVIGTNVWGVFLYFYFLSFYQHAALPEKEAMRAMTNGGNGDPTIIILNLIIGGGFSVFGGYAAASIAKKHVLLNATLASFLCVLSGLYALVINNSVADLPLILLSLPANPLLALAGGWLYQQFRLNKER